MFLSDKFVYVDLPKTGTITALKALETLGLPKRSGRHHQKPTPGEIAGRHVFATVRDPWSYYLSIWGYGRKHGRLSGPFNALTRFAPLKGRGASQGRFGAAWSVATYLWKAAGENFDQNKVQYYGDDAPENFRAWLAKILDPGSATLLSGPYSRGPLPAYAGFYTYRFCNMFCHGTERLVGRSLRDLDALQSWEEEMCYVASFIQTRNLVPELIQALAACGAVDDATAALDRVGGTRHNVSVGSEKRIREFYTPELVSAVAERDRLIIEKFGYEEPAL